MQSIRKWLYRPKRTDTSLLAQFYYADDELNTVAEELDSFDGRKDPERCTTLVNQLRTCQNRVLNICNRMMDEVIGGERVSRDFRSKFPDDVLQDNLAGQLWFGAECLAAGSCIMNRDSESASMRPLAKAVTKSLDSVRVHLREQCLKPPQEFSEQLCETLKIFDRLFAEFELRYVSAMVPVKSAREYGLIQDVIALFSETVQRALRLDLLCQWQVDQYEPALMFTIPRLAIVAGLVVFPDGPLRLDRDISQLSELFRPFKNLLCKIRELLWALTKSELFTLERCLCSVDEPPSSSSPAVGLDDQTSSTQQPPPPHAYPSLDIDAFVRQFYRQHPECRRTVNRAVWRETEAMLRHSSHTTASHANNDARKQQTAVTSTSFCRRRRGRQDHAVSAAATSPSAAVQHSTAPCCDAGVGKCARDPTASSSCSGADVVHVNGVVNDTDDVATSPSQQPVPAGDRMNGVPTISCDYGSRAEQRRQLENSMSELVTSLVDRAVLHCHHQPSSSSSSCLPPRTGDVRSSNHHSHNQQVRRRHARSQHHQVLHVHQAPSTSSSTSSAVTTACCWSPSGLATVQFTAPPTPGTGESFVGGLVNAVGVCYGGGSALSHGADTHTGVQDSMSRDARCADYDIALAIQAAEASTRNRARARFKDNRDMIQRLFVCISGVADQLQTNFAADLRHILKAVFQINATASSECFDADLKISSDCDLSQLQQSAQTEGEVVGSLDSAEEAVPPADISMMTSSSSTSAHHHHHHHLATNMRVAGEMMEVDTLVYDRGTSVTGAVVSASNVSSTVSSSATTTDTTQVQHHAAEVLVPAHLTAAIEPPLPSSPHPHDAATSPSSSAAAPLAGGDVLPAPDWLPDRLAVACMLCCAVFTVVRRRHHCRRCGGVFCGRCSNSSAALPQYGYRRPVRVCDTCRQLPLPSH